MLPAFCSEYTVLCVLAEFLRIASHCVVMKTGKRIAMEKTKYLFAVAAGLILLGTVTRAEAQTTFTNQAYQAYIRGDLAQWTDVIERLENVSGTQAEARQLELLNYYYGHIGFLLGNGAKAEAKKYLLKAMNRVDAVLDRNPSHPAALAYKGIFTAYRMSMNKITAPLLGPKTMQYIHRAYQSDPQSVEALTAMGNLLYHAPSMFGGDKAEGTAYIERAVARLETSCSTLENWNYLNLLVMQAQYLEQTGNGKDALAVYEKILRFEPGFVRVRDDLCPALRASLTGK